MSRSMSRAWHPDNILRFLRHYSAPRSIDSGSDLDQVRNVFTKEESFEYAVNCCIPGNVLLDTHASSSWSCQCPCGCSTVVRDTPKSIAFKRRHIPRNLAISNHAITNLLQNEWLMQVRYHPVRLGEPALEQCFAVTHGFFTSKGFATASFKYGVDPQF